MNAHNRIDNTGLRFGRLIAIEAAESYVAPNGKKKSMWKCKCDCGNEVAQWYTHHVVNNMWPGITSEHATFVIEGEGHQILDIQIMGDSKTIN